MKIPKVELKKAKSYLGREGYTLRADVYIDGIYCMEVYDDGNGGGNSYYEERSLQAQEAIKNLNEYIKTLPPYYVNEISDKPFPINLDLFIDQLYENMQKEKNKASFLKKRQKKCIDHLVFGVPDSDTYSFVKLNDTLANLGMTKRIELLLRIQRVKNNYFKKDYVFFNNFLEAGIGETSLKQFGII